MRRVRRWISCDTLQWFPRICFTDLICRYLLFIRGVSTFTCWISIWLYLYICVGVYIYQMVRYRVRVWYVWKETTNPSAVGRKKFVNSTHTRYHLWKFDQTHNTLYSPHFFWFVMTKSELCLTGHAIFPFLNNFKQDKSEHLPLGGESGAEVWVN